MGYLYGQASFLFPKSFPGHEIEMNHALDDSWELL